jgi:tRNA-dihydrouridine synthase
MRRAGGPPAHRQLGHLAIGRRQRGDAPDDALALFAETGCDAVMIGRATMKNSIFRQIDRLAGRPARGVARRPPRPDARPLRGDRATAFEPKRSTSCAR